MVSEVFDARPCNGAPYMVGDTSVPLAHVMVSTLLADIVHRCPDGETVVFRERNVRWTWHIFTEQAGALVAGLCALGLERGGRIGIQSSNCVEWVLTQFTTMCLGFILVNINPTYRLSELKYTFNKVGHKAIVAAEIFKTSRCLGMPQTLTLELTTAQPGMLNAAKLPVLHWVIRMGEADTPGMLNFTDVVARGKSVPADVLDAITATSSPDDIINVQLTSGMTSAPKGVTLTHVDVVNNACFITMTMNLQEGDRLCIPVPLYHCFSVVMSVLTCTATSTCMMFPGETFDPLVTLCMMAEERRTQLHGTPTMFIAQLDHPDFESSDVSALRDGIMAGSPCPIEVMECVVPELSLREVTITYGMTETSPVSFQGAVANPLDERIATVGCTQPYPQIKLVGGAGEVMPVGEKGELYTKGYSVVLGYWDDEAKTAKSIHDGRMRTDDLTMLDAEGYCNIVDRMKGVLIRGGGNVYSCEIEEFLFRHPKVWAASAFGAPDPKYGEEACAWIVLKPGQQAIEEEIRTFCQGQIARYKIPYYIRFVTEMPMTAAEKVQKFVMRDHMVEELRLMVAATA